MGFTKIIQARYDNNPNYLLDSMLNCIIQTGNSYPSDSSILWDKLRGQLQKLYGISLSMFDTHNFRVGSYTGVCSPDEYYIYEAPIKLINKLVGDYTNYFLPAVNFPEGVFIGFFPSEFKDHTFRMEHFVEFCKLVFIMYENLTIYLSSEHISDDILYIYRELFRINLISQIYDNGDEINWEWIQDEESCNLFITERETKNDDGSNTICVSGIYGHIDNYLTPEDIKTHSREIQNAYRCYNYAEAGDIYRKYGSVKEKLDRTFNHTLKDESTVVKVQLDEKPKAMNVGIKVDFGE